VEKPALGGALAQLHGVHEVK